MSAGDGTTCMATNLILNHGFNGFLFDGNEEYVERGIEFFRQRADCFLLPPRFRHAWITTDNVNQLLREAGATGDVDLFSLDLDGNDYWIWRAIEEIKPRLMRLRNTQHHPIGAKPYDQVRSRLLLLGQARPTG